MIKLLARFLFFLNFFSVIVNAYAIGTTNLATDMTYLALFFNILGTYLMFNIGFPADKEPTDEQNL